MYLLDHHLKITSIIVFYSYLVTDDLATVMIATNSIDNWPRLGLALGVPQPAINHIRQQYPNPLDQQEQILYHWIETGEATWAKLVTAITGPLVNKKGLSKEIARDHPGKFV